MRFAGRSTERTAALEGDRLGFALTLDADAVSAVLFVIAQEHGPAVGWSAPMVAHTDEVAALADRITAAMYERLAAGGATRVTVLHAFRDSLR
ncbi:hypothetical protein AWB68_07076 [Caballeronia choica]|jgi:hypothetical protein|uniref:Uncharacterized protein n=1 Tax=Caballeronia choica TaxID=326476 RepID=A0A158KTW3_9BURK|nr:hypothetical protein [Caballeronia choica]SAL83861.1 hypothetical protein AWB68_07076 [Caballeronia choica]